MTSAGSWHCSADTATQIPVGTAMSLPPPTADTVAVAIRCAGGWLHLPTPADAPDAGPSLPTTRARPGETAFEAAVRCCAEQLAIDVLPTHSDGLTPVSDGSGAVHTVVAHPATPEALTRVTDLGDEVVWLTNRRVAAASSTTEAVTPVAGPATD